MEISKVHRQEMEGIIAEMDSKGPECDREYECYKSSLEKLCKINSIGDYAMIECFDKKNACSCGLSLSLDFLRFCMCPLRRYIAEQFHR